MIDLDYISIIVIKKQEQHLMNGVLYMGNVFTLNLSQNLGIKLEKSPWAPSLSTHEGLLIKETRHNHQITMSGEFFLKKEYMEQLDKIIKYLVENNYQFHFTRVDIAHTTTENLREILKLMEEIKSLDEMTFKKRGDITYQSFYNSRFSLVIYNKKEQVKKLQKKNPKYYKEFQDKYYKITEHNISRVEVRIKGKDTLSLLKIIKNAEEFTQKIHLIYIENIKKRLKDTKIERFLTESLNLSQKNPFTS